MVLENLLKQGSQPPPTTETKRHYIVMVTVHTDNSTLLANHVYNPNEQQQNRNGHKNSPDLRLSQSTTNELRLFRKLGSYRFSFSYENCITSLKWLKMLTFIILIVRIHQTRNKIKLTNTRRLNWLFCSRILTQFGKIYDKYLLALITNGDKKLT